MVRKFRPSVTISTRFSAEMSKMLLDLANREQDGNVSGCIREAVYHYLKSKGYKLPEKKLGSQILETVSA